MAQLDNAADSDSEERGFESLRAGQKTRLVSTSRVFSYIRLWRVILLRSDICLATSDIRFASFMANRIPRKPQGFHITIAVAIISLFAKAKNITKKAEKERAYRNFVTALLSLLFLLPVSHLYNKCFGLSPYPYQISTRKESLNGQP